MQPQPQKLVDVPAETFEKFMKAAGETFAKLPQVPTQAQIQAALAEAAEAIDIRGPHANVLALRYSLFVTVLTQHTAALKQRGLFSGDAGAGKTGTFTRSFVAAIARLPCRFAPNTGFVFDLGMLWKLIEAAKKSGVDDPAKPA